MAYRDHTISTANYVIKIYKHCVHTHESKKKVRGAVYVQIHNLS